MKNKKVKAVRAWAVVIKADKDGYDGMKKQDKLNLNYIYESAQDAEAEWGWDLADKRIEIIQVEIRPVKNRGKS